MDSTTINTLKDAAEIVVDKPFFFEISIIPQNKWQAWLIKKGWRPAKRNLAIKPIVLGNLIRISKLLLTIDRNKNNEGKGYLDVSYHLVSDHADTVVEIIAIAIQNTKQDPSGELMELIKNNLTPRELMTMLAMVLHQMDVTNFLSSIISIRGLNVLDNGEKQKPENGVSPSMQGS